MTEPCVRAETSDDVDGESPQKRSYPLQSLVWKRGFDRWHLRMPDDSEVRLISEANVVGFRWHRSCDRSPTDQFVLCKHCGNLPPNDREHLYRPTFECLRTLEIVIAPGEDARQPYRLLLSNDDEADRLYSALAAAPYLKIDPRYLSFDIRVRPDGTLRFERLSSVANPLMFAFTRLVVRERDVPESERAQWYLLEQPEPSK
jgi:hypothetical protein